MGVLQSRMRMDISVVRGSRACTMRVPGSASAVHAPGLLPAPARDRDQCRAQDAHGAGRARRSAPQKWLTRWHPASPGSLNTYTWPSRCSVRRTRTAQDAHGQRPTKVAHPLAPGVSGVSEHIYLAIALLRAQDAHGAGRARRSAPQKWLTRWHPASPGPLPGRRPPTLPRHRALVLRLHTTGTVCAKSQSLVFWCKN